MLSEHRDKIFRIAILLISLIVLGLGAANQRGSDVYIRSGGSGYRMLLPTTMTMGAFDILGSLVSTLSIMLSLFFERASVLKASFVLSQLASVFLAIAFALYLGIMEKMWIAGGSIPQYEGTLALELLVCLLQIVVVYRWKWNSRGTPRKMDADMNMELSVTRRGWSDSSTQSTSGASSESSIGEL